MTGGAGGLIALAGRYGVLEGSEELRRLLEYWALLRKWNTKMNLTASTAWVEISWLFEEALWAAVFYPTGGLDHLDLGSGAGFPAIPLKIMRPGMRLRMVEGRSKRAVFLETAAERLGLMETEVFCGRVEEYLDRTALQGFDVVSWKGLKLSPQDFRLILKRSRPQTHIWLFHGSNLPMADPSTLHTLPLVRRERFPSESSRWLSVYSVMSHE